MIRTKIKEERIRRETTVFIEKLREQTPVWIAGDLSTGLTPLTLPGNGQAVQEAARPGDAERQTQR
jgi:hypothetical protein